MLAMPEDEAAVEDAGDDFVGALATVLTHLASVGRPQRATRSALDDDFCESGQSGHAD